MSSPDEVAPARAVLLVEDEPLVAMVAADLLSAMGYHVVEAGTAALALKQAHSDCARFDFALIDMGLPDRPGEQLVLDLRKIRDDLPIIVASGYGQSELRLRFKDHDRFVFLNKPYQRASLGTAIDALGLIALPGEQPRLNGAT
jgi:CheY-like chemotaxis protein